jgi:effector-binding domain-containing protein
MGLFGGDKIKVKKRSETAIAYIEARGPYGKIPYGELYEKLFAWAKEAKAAPGFTTFAIYASCPKETAEADLVTKVGIPLYKSAEPKGDVKVDRLPGMEVAVKRHEGPAEEYDKSYGELTKWISDNGYKITGPAMEIFTKKPKVRDGKNIIFSEIQFPVAKA